jgi:hypothetical protein
MRALMGFSPAWAGEIAEGNTTGVLGCAGWNRLVAFRFDDPRQVTGVFEPLRRYDPNLGQMPAKRVDQLRALVEDNPVRVILAAQQLLRLTDVDQNGRVSKREFMQFMEVEFDRRDVDGAANLRLRSFRTSVIRPLIQGAPDDSSGNSTTA